MARSPCSRRSPRSTARRRTAPRLNGPIEDPGVTGRAAYAALLEEGAGALLGVEGAQ